ncbi:MAG: hypothetical protein HOP31_00230 [Ignavibacteria bacterium]|nr:hypothetical protein [Ignavibacteria bacterium]
MLNNNLNASKFQHAFLLPYLNEAYLILSDSYKDLVSSGTKYNSYNENSLRDALVKAAEKKKKRLQFVWDTESRDIQNKNVRIDISLIYSLDLDYVDERIFIECKIINSTNTQDYVDRNGIKSFVECKYCEKLPLAGMLAFVTVGSISKFVSDVNDILKSHSTITTNIYLSTITGYCQSNHNRTNGASPIDIYHLILDYQVLI